MKVYQVTKSYFDGDHDHGTYRSPLFATKKLAEEFASKVHGDVIDWTKKWESAGDWPQECAPAIRELEVLEESPPIYNSKEYLEISWT